MSTSSTLGTVVAETCPLPPGACRSCERKGLPILPLRLAVVPANKGLQRHGQISNPALQYGARVLREGYVYVLLDRKDWQAYQVTPEGYLRQFSPYEMPRADPSPLSVACITANHDLRASFLHVDEKYQSAWIAFAQDPWDKAVLDAYKAGKDVDGSPGRTDVAQRFVRVDLSAIKASPAQAQALALEHGNRLDGEVAEYTSGVQDFGSVHGWYSRQSRAQAMRDYLGILETQYHLSGGVAGVILPDAVGNARELNNLRLAQCTQKQRWAEKPENRYRYLTSKCLLGIKAVEAARASHEAETAARQEAMDVEIYNNNKHAHTLMATVDVARRTETLTELNTRDLHQRLENRYDENARKAFQDHYDKAVASAQENIDAYATDWAEVIVSDDWQRLMALDYTDQSPRSRTLRLKAVADCLDGGITDAPPASPGPTPEILGPSGKVWKTLLNDPQSALYVALQGRQTPLIQHFIPTFAAGALPNEAGKKYYDAVKTMAGSKEITAWREQASARAADRLLASLHAASGRLGAELSEGVKAALSDLYQGASWLYGNVRLTQVTVSLRVSECFDLLSQALHGTASAVEAGVKRQVRAMVFAGLITIPDRAVREMMVEITVWAQGAAEEVKKQLTAMGQDAQEAGRGAKQGAQEVARQVKAGLKNLEPLVEQTLLGITLTGQSAKQAAQGSVASLRRLVAGGVDGGLSLVSLYFLEDSLKSSLAALDTALGKTHAEVVSAFYSAAVSLMGASVEAAGVAVKVPADMAQAFIGRAGEAVTPRLSAVIGLGTDLVKVGGVITAVSGIADASASFAAAIRVAKVGDKDARNAYAVACGLSIASVWFSVQGVWGAATLMGPLGIGIALGLLAFAAVQIAKSQESTALEIWASNCCFGIDPEYQRWGLINPEKKTPVDETEIPNLMNSAVAALNAAVIGMAVELQFGAEPAPAGPDIGMEASPLLRTLTYGFSLPNYDPDLSSYQFTLSLERYGLSKMASDDDDKRPQILPTGSDNNTEDCYRGPFISERGVWSDKETKPTAQTPVLRGRYWFNDLESIKSATLTVTYWPDKTDENGYAHVTLKEKT